jgi:hypothetical protein
MHVDTAWKGDLRARLRLRFEEATGAPASSFQVVHERELHLFVVGRDAGFFQHVHPGHDGKAFTVELEFPEPGDYMVYADFVPVGGTPQLLQQMIVTPTAASGANSAGARDLLGRRVQKRRPVSTTLAVRTPEGFDATRNGVGIHLDVEELRAGTPALLTFTLKDMSGAPIRDLQPYLGAAGHLFLVSGDLTDASHSHPLEMSNGPRIRFLTRFAWSGPYRVWLQIQRGGQVITTVYALDVPPP